MTNKEWLLTLPSTQVYAIMDWLMHTYGKRFTDTRIAVTDWLDKDHDSTVIEALLFSMVSPPTLST